MIKKMSKKCRLLFFALAVILLSVHGFSAVISGVDVQVLDEQVQIHVTTATPVKYTVRELKSPFRVVVDMPSSIFPKVSENADVNTLPVAKIRLQQFQKNIVRLVVEFTEAQPYRVLPSQNGFMVSVPRIPEPAPQVLGSVPSAADEAELSKTPAEVTSIQMKREGSKILLMMKSSGKLKYKFKEIAKPPSFSIQLPGAKLSSNVEELLVEAFGVSRVVPSQKKEDVVVTVYLDKMLPYDIALVDDGKTVQLTVEGEVKQVKQKEKEKEKEVAVTPSVTKKEESSETKTEKKKEEKKETVATDVKKEEKKEEEKEEAKSSDIKGPKITAIETQENDNKVSLKITGSEALQPDVREQVFPSRLEVVFKNVLPALKSDMLTVNKGALTSVAVKQKPEPAETRVTASLVRMVPYEMNFENDGKDIVIVFETTQEVKDILAKQKESTAEVKVETKKKETAPKEDAVPVKETKKKKQTLDIKKEPVKVPVLTKETKKQETLIQKGSAFVTIKSVEVKKLKEKVLVYVNGTNELRYKIRESENPDKLVFEFYNAKLGFKDKSVSVEQGNLTTARVYQSQKAPVPVVRVAMDFLAKTKYEAQLAPQGKQLLITADAPMGAKPKVAKKMTSTKLPVLPLPQVPDMQFYNDKINMDFVDADVRDIFRIFAEITGKNIIVAPDVTAGILITLSLKDVPLGQALDMVVNSVSSTLLTTTGQTTSTGTSGTTTTQSASTGNLKYRIVGNTIVVSFNQDILDRMGSGVLVGDLMVETFAIKGYTKTEFEDILDKLVPELTVIGTPDRPKDLITLVGPKYSLQRARTLILGLTPIPEVLVETFNVGNLSPDDVETALKTAIPEASVVDKKKGNPPNYISISGSSYTLKKVEKFAADLTLKQNVTFDVIQTRETKPDEIEKLLKAFVPGVQVVRSLVGSDTYSTTLAGTTDEITAAKKLIENLEGGSGRTKGAMTVEAITLKHIDTVTALQEQSVDIESLLKGMVPGLSENAKIFLDKRNNMLVVSASVSDIEKVKKAVEKIDVKLPQVVIAAQVVDFTTSGAKTFSANFVESSSAARGITMTDKGSFVGTGTFTFSMLGVQFVNTLNALVQQGKARVLASPKVLALSGKEANITLTDQIPYTVEQSTTGQFGQIIKTVNTQYESVGITLKLTPRVNESGEILLQINPKVETITSTPSQGQRPAKNSREVNTLMRIADGDSIIIGGLINSSERETMAKIPILSKLPLLGKLFTATNTSKSDSELAIIITAEIKEE